LISDGSYRGKLSSNRCDPDPDAFLAAVSDVAKARAMTDVAAHAGLGRESLYKALRHKWGRGTLKQNNVPRPHLFCAGDLQPVHLVVHASRQ
jgi:hypothetical protein